MFNKLLVKLSSDNVPSVFVYLGRTLCLAVLRSILLAEAQLLAASSNHRI